MQKIKKSDLHFIGHLRGIDQYEVLSDVSLLVLSLGNRYFLSRVDNWQTDYNSFILTRISLFYRGTGKEAFECLGEEVEIVEEDK